jgi:hypothetical protein
MKNPLMKTIVAAGVLLEAASGVCSANLIVNGGFETGALTGWTGSGVVNNVNPDTGVYAAVFGPSGSSISQTFATTPGKWYDGFLALANDYDGGHDAFSFFAIGMQSVSPLIITNALSFGYKGYIFSGPATGTSITLTFDGLNRHGAFYLDDVSITPHVNVTADGGSTLTILLIGITGLVFARYSMSWRKASSPAHLSRARRSILL